MRSSFLALALVLVASCQTVEKTSVTNHQYYSIDTSILSRGVRVPVTYVEPISQVDGTFPLVVMAHGHGGTRHEQGSFRVIADRLAARGIASIRMDFPGSGDSTEAFSQYNLTNMSADFLAARDYAVARPNIDKDRVALFGWSMGGRLVLLLGARNNEFKLIATWSPAASNDSDSMVSFLGGRAGYDRLRAQALRDGSVPFTTQWGQDQELGLKWFEDLENSRPLDQIRQFNGPLLVLYGDLDDVVAPEVSEAVIKAAINSREVVRHVVIGADHGMGIFSNEGALTEEAIDATVLFLSDRL